jgi:hypothetical protein
MRHQSVTETAGILCTAAAPGSRTQGQQRVLIGVVASNRLVPKPPANRFALAHHSRRRKIAVRELDATAHLALQQHGQLMPQRSILASSRLLDDRRQHEAILSSDQYRQGFRAHGSVRRNSSERSIVHWSTNLDGERTKVLQLVWKLQRR